MKRNKIIGLLVAFGGMVASFAGASALYKKAANQTGFGIGASYSGATGSIAYKINGGQSGTINGSFLDDSGHNGGHAYSPTYTQAEFIINLSADYPNTMAAQPYVLGNLKVQLTNVAEALQNKAHLWMKYCDENGVEANAFTGEYADKWVGSSENRIMESDAVINAASYTFAKDIAVSATGEHYVRILIKLMDSHDGLTDAQWLALAEGKPFDLTISWGAPYEASGTEYGRFFKEQAYVSGEQMGWGLEEEFAMVPNLKSTTFQWMFLNLTGVEGNAKPKTGADWSGGSDTGLNKTHTYDFYWDGTNGSSYSCVDHNA